MPTNSDMPGELGYGSSTRSIPDAPSIRVLRSISIFSISSFKRITDASISGVALVVTLPISIIARVYKCLAGDVGPFVQMNWSRQGC